MDIQILIPGRNRTMDVIDNESLLKAILDGSNQMVQVSRR